MTDTPTTYPTGLPTLDDILGIGGLPKGRFTEMFGTDTDALAEMALVTVAQAQKTGAVAAYLDLRATLDLRTARELGVDCIRMLLSQPDTPDMAWDMLEVLVRSHQVGIVVVDDVPRLECQDPTAPEGLQQRQTSRRLRKLSQLALDSGTTVVFLSVARSDLHVVNALRFFASVRLQVSELSGPSRENAYEILVTKNNYAAPYRSCEAKFVLGKGYATEE